MANERLPEFQIDVETDRFFDDSSVAQNGPPRIVILAGGPASGKTTLRKQRFSTGYVLVDAAEIFLNLSRGEFFPFPGPLEERMELVGRRVAERAIAERRHIVTEIIGADVKPAMGLLHAMSAVGYKVELQAVTCDVGVAAQRNAKRGDDCISAYYAEAYQGSWLYEAARAALTTRQSHRTAAGAW
jgi:hypothetical protein